ncbi:uncharacterized [Tachysurus ichikawai]
MKNKEGDAKRQHGIACMFTAPATTECRLEEESDFWQKHKSPLKPGQWRQRRKRAMQYDCGEEKITTTEKKLRNQTGMQEKATQIKATPDDP